MVARGFSPTLHHAEQIPGEGRNLVDEDFGLYEFDDLVVLKTAAMPAVLLECGVIVNRNEEASLQTPEIQHRIADAAAEAIMQFLHYKQTLQSKDLNKKTRAHRSLSMILKFHSMYPRFALGTECGNLRVPAAPGS